MVFLSLINEKSGWSNIWRNAYSPNYNDRPTDQDVSLLVIHCISLPAAKYGGSNVEDFFLNRLDTSKDLEFNSLRTVKVSAHFFIKRTGEIVQFVSVYDRAWHAGKSIYRNSINCNDFSVGVELEGVDNDLFHSQQYESLVILTKELQRMFPLISNNRIVGHEEISPGRKTDPGSGFDWDYYLDRLSLC